VTLEARTGWPRPCVTILWEPLLVIVNSINNWLGTAILHDTDNAVRSVNPPPLIPSAIHVLLAR